MEQSDKLKLFLALEVAAELFDLNPKKVDEAERVRELMDPLWYELSDAEREYLNSRTSRG